LEDKVGVRFVKKKIAYTFAAPYQKGEAQ